MSPILSMIMEMFLFYFFPGIFLFLAWFCCLLFRVFWLCYSILDGTASKAQGIQAKDHFELSSKFSIECQNGDFVC